MPEYLCYKRDRPNQCAVHTNTLSWIDKEYDPCPPCDPVAIESIDNGPMVGLHDHIIAILRNGLLTHHETRIVDEYVKSLGK